MTLRWLPEPDGRAELAYSGEAIIGMVVHQSVGEQLWAYTVDGVHAKWVGKVRGRVKSKATAKRAVERTWAAWLAHAALAPVNTGTAQDSGV